MFLKLTGDWRFFSLCSASSFLFEAYSDLKQRKALGIYDDTSKGKPKRAKKMTWIAMFFLFLWF